MSLSLLTDSRLRSARACQRKHRIEYVLGYRPVESAAVLRFGSLGHRGLEAWWLAPSGSRLDAAFMALRSARADPFDLVTAEEMLRGYDARWGPDMADIDVLGVEVEFRTELRNPETGRPSQTWSLAGKIDVVISDRRAKRVLIVEHKTSSMDISPGSEYWARLRMDGQVSMYFEGGRSLGFEISGCLYDVLGKPGMKPLKATPEENRKYKKDGTLYAVQRERDEAPEEYRARLVEDIAANPASYYQRGEVARLEGEMSEALFDIWQLGQQIREAELANRAPRNPDSCVQYGRTCPWFDVCSGVASLEDVSRFKKLDTLHPELTGAGAVKEVA